MSRAGVLDSGLMTRSVHIIIGKLKRREGG